MATIKEPLADARDMFAVHTVFRREFGLMSGLVRAVAAGDQRLSALVVDHIALMSRFVEVHHSGEDMHTWPRLRTRVPEEIVSILDVMELQHSAVHAGLLQVNAVLQAWRESASVETRNAVADVIDRFVPVLEEHLALEEKRVVPLIERYLTAAEYALSASEAAAAIPPDKLPVIFGMFMYEAAPAVVDMVVSVMPAEVQPVIRDLAVESYAAYAQALYGTVAPRRVTRQR